MDAVKFIKERERMCDSDECINCPLYKENNLMGVGCETFEKHNPEVTVEIVKKWSSEHPVKTRQSEFLKMFPDVELEDNIIKILPCEINTKIKDECYRLRPCCGCRKKYWLSEVK